MPGNNLVLLIILFVEFVSCRASGQVDQNNSSVMPEKRLYEYLMSDMDYEKAIRPVQSSGDAVTVEFGLALISLADLNDQEQTLTVNVWQRMFWLDAQLNWKPDSFDGITQLRIPIAELWTPDIVPYNTGHGRFDYTFDKTHAIVYNDGSVMWFPSVILTTICPLDLTYFPHDTQVCKIEFGSWTHSNNTLKLTNFNGERHLDLSDYIPHHKWDVLNATGELKEEVYPCCPEESFSSIIYKLMLRRNAGYLQYLLVSPAVMMALLTPVMFMMPAESGEKITLGTGLLVTMTLLLLFIEVILPNSSTMPLIGYYYVSALVTTCVSLASSTAITSVWYRSLTKRPMPGFLQTVVGLVGRVLFVSHDDITAAGTMRFRRLESVDGPEGGDTDQIVAQDTQAPSISEWRQLAIILDRICFVIFFVTMVVISTKLASRP